MSPSGKIHILVDPEFHKQVKLFAVQYDLSVTALIEKALKEYMEKHSTEQK